ncbi:hypothetical protein BDU57DRAFT_155480 [Ampelomyces quisqualis]|uniref:Uncharacterized protein n=1 Tax=Ampelomyces quisqualis TaxID=50730 RepID=A0A6A5QX99_AMPQU|nr:hypothetical protein BDU57DRAFT_155480 [Ampelomyces quisqualis]
MQHASVDSRIQGQRNDIQGMRPTDSSSPFFVLIVKNQMTLNLAHTLNQDLRPRSERRDRCQHSSPQPTKPVKLAERDRSLPLSLRHQPEPRCRRLFDVCRMHVESQTEHIRGQIENEKYVHRVMITISSTAAARGHTVCLFQLSMILNDVVTMSTKRCRFGH